MSAGGERVAVADFFLISGEKQKILPVFLWVLYIFFGEFLIFPFFIYPVNMIGIFL